MADSQEKKVKKHHHHHNNHNKSVIPPKKSKGPKKKKHGRSTTKLSMSTSKGSVNVAESRMKVKKEESYDTLPLVPTIAASDTAVNFWSEQPSTPTKAPKGTGDGMSMPTVGVSAPHTPLPPITVPVPVSPPPPPPPPQKWKAEEVAMRYMEKLDAAMARLEYVEVVSSTQVNIERDCQIWKKNLQKNQNDAYPIMDATLVKIPNQPDDYVNLSAITVPHCQYPILMGQIPKKGCEEEFWKATFYEGVVMMYVLIGKDDESCEFFPTTNGAYCYYGCMFINIRKVEKMDEERTRYTIEVLPNGLSNSVMTNVYVHTGWEPHGVPVKYANTTRSVVDVMNFLKTSNGTDKLMIVSRNGVGRAGFFVSLGAAFCCLNDQSEPRIGEIVKAIRLQRPNAVDSMKQYASLYLCLLYYIKKKSTIPDGMKQKVEDVTKAFEALIREDLSIMY
ncbi:unnamed protein product [Caenorhabditis sp. 36 PRJEB53466]|nr:unnamed protein product [Caenorhabditis sp. 36 PRJEB53466]